MNVGINIDAILERVKELFPDYDKNEVSSNQYMVAKLMQYIYCCTKDVTNRYKCEKCGAYGCSADEMKAFKYCPRCGTKLL